MTNNDIYDQEIAILKAHPERIYDHWNYETPLFAVLGDYDDYHHGCLTQIKSRPHDYQSKNNIFDKQIAKDDKIPDDGHEITVDDLEVFANYQRAADKIYGRKVEKDFSYLDYQSLVSALKV